MTENLMNSTVSYDILEAVNGERQDALTAILNDYRSALNATGAFDANVQNLAVAEFFLTKNAPQFLSRAEKKNASAAKSAAVANESQDPTETLNAMYLLHNLSFFRCLVQRHLSFEDEAGRAFRLDLSRVVLVDKKSPKAPPFPLVKLFLLDLNAKFNARDEAGLVESLGRLRQFRKQRKAAETEQREAAPFVPLLAGAQFFNLCFYEQNLYCPAEIEAIYRVFKLATRLLLRDERGVDKGLTKLAAAIEAVTAVPASSAEPKLVSETAENSAYYEPAAKERLLKHLRALHAFFSAWTLLFVKKDVEGCLKTLSSDALTKKGKFRSIFAFPASNLLAAAAAASNSPTSGLALLSSLLAAKPRPRQPPRLVDVGPQNAALATAATAFNLAVLQAEAGQLEAAAAGLAALATQFRGSAAYHYRCGLVGFRLLLRRLDEAAASADELYYSVLAEDTAKFRDSKLKRYSCNAFNVAEELRKKEPLAALAAAAIASFSSCVRLLKKEVAPDAAPGQLPALVRARSEAVDLSCHEHLAFLFLLSKEPLKALEAVSEAETVASADQSRLACYAAAAWTQLGRPDKALARLDPKLASSKTATTAFYPIGRATHHALTVGKTVQYNRAVAAYYSRDRDARGRLLDEYFAESEEILKKHGGPGLAKSGAPNFQLHLMYCHQYADKPSPARLAEILKAVDCQGGTLNQY